MGIHDVEQVEGRCQDDGQVAVAPVGLLVALHLIDRHGQFAGRAVPEFVAVRVGVVVRFEPDGARVTLVAAVVPVDDVDEGGKTAHHQRHFPVAAVVDLSGSGTDDRQGCGRLDGVGLAGGVVDDGVAQEVEVGGDRRAEEHLLPGVVLNHLGLYRVEQVAVAAEVGAAEQVVVLVAVADILLVLLDAEVEGGSGRGVEHRNFPVVAVVELAEAGYDGRYGRQGSDFQRVPEQGAVAVEGRIGPQLHAPQLAQLAARKVGHGERIIRHGERIGSPQRERIDGHGGRVAYDSTERIGRKDDVGVGIDGLFLTGGDPVGVATEFGQVKRRMFGGLALAAQIPAREALGRNHSLAARRSGCGAERRGNRKRFGRRGGGGPFSVPGRQVGQQGRSVVPSEAVDCGGSRDRRLDGTTALDGQAPAEQQAEGGSQICAPSVCHRYFSSSLARK